MLGDWLQPGSRLPCPWAGQSVLTRRLVLTPAMGGLHTCRSQRAWIWRWMTAAFPKCAWVCLGCVLLLLASCVRNTGHVMTYTRNTGQLTANTRNARRVVAYTRNTGQLMTNTRTKRGVLPYARTAGHVETYVQRTGNVTELIPVQVTSASITRHKVEKQLPWWDGGLCPCDGDNCLTDEAPLAQTSSHTPSADVGGTCGRRSWAAGDGQRVVSFSLYGDNPEYWQGLDDILSQVRRLYPGWVVRLYTDPRGRGSVLCPLLQEHAHLYVCDVTGLPPPLGDLSQVHRAMWRLAPLGDPQVVTLIVRDLDSQITEREAAAVREWLSSEKHFHAMRDHPYHDLPIMAGMWGARWDQDPALVRQAARDMAALRDSMLKKAHGLHGYIDDQYILAELLYPAMTDRVMAHDSYWCGTYERVSTPWPTQREGGVFVGSRRYKNKHRDEVILEKCPIKCRPPEHPDWVYC